MSTKTRSSTKRKPNSPADKISNTQRRRFLSSSLPDLSETIVNSVDPPNSSGKMDSATTMPQVESSNYGSSHHQEPPLLHHQGQTFSLPEIILGAFKNQNLVTQLVPVLAEAIKPTLQHAVECAFKTLTETIQNQSELITKQNERINSLTDQLNDADKSNQDLQHQIWRLEESLEELEQYSRRTSLRFHNCHLQNKQSNTDNVIIDICRDKLGIQLVEEDIYRSHPIGKPNSKGRSQIICRFQNWKTKQQIFSAKRKLKNSDVFITEDLTRYRQGIIHELTCAKRERKIHSFWTNDGRIFTKLSDNGQKYLIKSVDDLHKIAPPHNTAQTE